MRSKVHSQRCLQINTLTSIFIAFMSRIKRIVAYLFHVYIIWYSLCAYSKIQSMCIFCDTTYVYILWHNPYVYFMTQPMCICYSHNPCVYFITQPMCIFYQYSIITTYAFILFSQPLCIFRSLPQMWNLVNSRGCVDFHKSGMDGKLP